MLSLPALTEQHQASRVDPGTTSNDMIPDWMAWSPNGNLYAVAWTASPVEGEVRQQLQLQIQAAADGSIHGRASLPWGYSIRYRWMEHGDCIVILICLPDSHGDVAHIISCTGQVLQVIGCDPPRRAMELSLHANYLQMEWCEEERMEYMEDSWQIRRTCLSVFHLQSGSLVFDDLIDVDSSEDYMFRDPCPIVWSHNDQMCSALVFAKHRLFIHFQGEAAAMHSSYHLEAFKLSWSGSTGETQSFSPFQQMLVGSHSSKGAW